ncbi:MAG: hypothetical protein IT287_00595, partial [Bdellovibrionaceae bacterium]|nr:hypothetical protein [Pseudobdellovibrionaceae bacterium]
ISSREINDLSSKHFALYDFTLENTSSDFVKVKSARLDFGSDTLNSQMVILRGNDLVSWADAAQQQRAINDYNTQLALASVSLLGIGVMMAANEDMNVILPAAAVAAASASASDAHALLKYKQSLEQTRLHTKVSAYEQAVPYSHLYSGAFSIPPGLHTKKWLTVYSPQTQNLAIIKSAQLILDFEDGRQESLTVTLRKANSQHNGRSNMAQYKQESQNSKSGLSRNIFSF